MSKYLTVVGFKGGIAKSTTAVHLAAYLSQKGTVLLVDGDDNRSVTSWARKATLPFEVVDERVAPRKVKENNYQYVVVDTQARPNQDDLEALAEASDFLIVPTTPDYLSLDALRQTTNALRSLGANRFRVLITKVPPPPRRDVDEARSVIESLGLPVFTNHIRRYSAFEDAAAHGVPVYNIKGANAKEGWKDYVAAWQELNL
jgi:chromosome partitioning protein